MMVRTKTLAVLWMVWTLPASVSAQQLQRFTLGSEFQVNTYTTSYQYRPKAAVDARGTFVVVWQGSGAGGPDEVFGQRFSSLGLPLGTEFQVNTYTTNFQYNVDVAAEADGDFVVVWESYDGDLRAVRGQRYTSAGNAVGTEFDVTNSLVGGGRPRVAIDGDGDFVVVWDNDDYDGFGVFGKRFASSGAPLGTEFLVNSYTTNNQYYGAVAAEANGDFIVVWGSSAGNDGDGRGVFGQRYASSGIKLGTEFQVNSYTTSDQGAYGNQAVTADADGDFVVVWGDYRLVDGDLYGRRFASSGVALGTDFLVNTYTTGIQGGQAGGRWLQSIAADAAGNFVVVWTTDYDGSSYGASGQAFRAAAGQIGTEFQVNSHTTDDQRYPTVATNAAGDFVVVWQSENQDGSVFGIFGQRYVLAYEFDSQLVGGGGTFGTDTGEADGTSQSDPVETTVETPNPGTVTIIERATSTSPPFGLSFLGQLVNIEAPAATAGAPLRITFELDSSLFRSGQSPTSIAIYRNNMIVPNCPGSVLTCTGGPTTITGPDDPCVSIRCVQTDLDVQLTVLTSAASDWAFSMDCTTGFTKGSLTIKEKSPGHEKLVAKLLGGPVIAQTDFGNPLVADGSAYRVRIFDDAQNLVGEAGVNRAGDTTCSGGSTDCWAAIGAAPPDGKGYKYKDDDRTADGIAQIQLKSSGSGSKILFKAKGPTPPFPAGIPDALTSTTAVTVEVQAENAPAPSCYSITLPTIKHQDADIFKAK